MIHILVQLTRATLFVTAALFPIVNPLGSALIFLSLTRGYPHQIRRALVNRITVNSLLLLVVSILIGSHVLDFFGISVPVVQVAGGLVVFATGWTLLQNKESDPTPQAISADEAEQQAFYPLTLPITVGPGSISVAITLGANTQRHAYAWPVLLASAVLGPALIALSVYICYRSAERVERWLGHVGMSVFLRLSSFIVICIGAQIFWNGLSALLQKLP
jgi:multiple antibiotic resistance protein